MMSIFLKNNTPFLLSRTLFGTIFAEREKERIEYNIIYCARAYIKYFFPNFTIDVVLFFRNAAFFCARIRVNSVNNEYKSVRSMPM